MTNDDEVDDRCKFMHGQPKLNVDQQFYLLLRLLREKYPPEHPVRVRRVNMPCKDSTPLQGQCGLANSRKPKEHRYFNIWISKSSPWSIQLDTIIHEWAHALTWYQLPEGKDHGDVFARKYGVLYREFIED